MQDLDFNKGDTVYTQDGTNYYFDHVAGEHGYVSPIIIVQSTNYRGDDFEEHEEVADHVIPIHLSRLSKTPWVRKIHTETTAAIAGKKAALDELNEKIGAAHTELRLTEQNMEQRRKEIEGESRSLERRFQWVKEFKMLIGEADSFILYTGERIPCDCRPFEITLKRDSGTPSTWNFVGRFNDGDEDVIIFPSENAMKAHVSVLFLSAEGLTISDEIAWFRRWPHLTISEAAKIEMEAKAELDRVRKLERAQENLAAAQAEVDKWSA